jgi:immunity protein Imm1 of predicted polymorphic toxin system
MHALVIVDQDREPVGVTTAAELEHAVGFASEEARMRGMLNVIYIEAPNGDALSLVVGGDETVLGFTCGHGDPPSYESRGPVADDRPLLTAYVSLKHHTEFPRRCVIPMQMGMSAAKEFVETGSLPTCVSWAET